MTAQVTAPRIAIVGSLNMDLIARTQRLPAAGETVGGGVLTRQPGGKGGNQAAAAARLGAATRMIGAVGADADGAALVQALRSAGVDTADIATVPEPTGTALIVVDAAGENQIAVCPGANAVAAIAGTRFGADEAVLTQLEISLELAAAAAQRTRGLFALNASPARPLPAALVDRADLIIVNETEFAALPELRSARSVVVTRGAAGAEWRIAGQVDVAVPAQAATVVSSVGAGDAFAAALVVGVAAGFSRSDALTAACAVGAAAVEDAASQPALHRLADYLDR